MLKVLKNLKAPEWIMCGIIVVVVLATVYFDLLLPEYMGKVVAEVISVSQGAGSVENIFSAGLSMFLAALFSIACSAISGFLASLIGTRFAYNTRNNMFDKVQSFSAEEINKFSTPSLITRTTNDIQITCMVFLLVLRMAISAPTMAVWALIKVIDKSPQLTVITAVGILCVVLLNTALFYFVIPKFRLMQKYTDRLNGVMREGLTGVRVVRAYNAQQFQAEAFEKANDDITKNSLFVHRAMAFLMPGMHLIMSGVSLVIVWAGAFLVGAGKLEVVTMTEFTQYSMQILISFFMLSMVFINIPRGSVSAKRINEVLDTKTSIMDGTGRTWDGFKGIEFKNVSFKYSQADDYVLKDISFSAKPSQTIAFIGSTGSGKSTLINLIPRFYDVTEGEIIIDGRNIKDYRLFDLNEKLGFVPQKGYLFDGTIAENLRVGKENATEEQMWTALKVAQADFVEQLEGGLDYHISAGGKNVSGGQRQRLSIARAVIRDPQIYIFDDSFSALDYKTDKNLRAALKAHTKNATVFIVATRIGTIMDADKIVVLEKGKAVGIGTHRELLRDCEVYQEIAYSQLSKEELENESK